MKNLVIITARMSSNRLPGKVMMKIKGEPIIKIIIDRIKKSSLIKKVVVSTTNLKSDDTLAEYLSRKKIEFFRGEEKNVVKRVIDTSDYYKAKNIILITGDCPLVDYNLIDQCVKVFEYNDCDFVTNANIRSFPDGMDVQVFKSSLIKKYYKTIKNKEEFEHVTLSIRRKIDKKKIINICAGEDLFYPNMGLTLDEIKDFKLIKFFFYHFWKNKKDYFNIYQIINFINKNKKLLLINSKVKRKDDK